MRSALWSVLLSAVLLVPPLARPAGAQAPVAVLAAESEISYSGTSVLHGWTGTSRRVSGTLRLDLAQPARSAITVRAPVASFGSGNGARDRKMREVTHAARHPDVVFTARTVRADAWAGAPGSRRGQWTVAGDLAFAGTTRSYTVQVAVREENGRFVAEGAFPVSLTAHGVERPRLGPIPIGDTIQLRFAIRAPLPA